MNTPEHGSPIRLFDCRLADDAVAVVDAVLASGDLASGPQTAALEAAVSERLHGRDVVAVSDMTHAMMMALRLSGVGPGDDVLTLSFNCLSSNAAIANIGARPVWVDLDPATATMSATDIESAITPRTKALVVYHVAGAPADLRTLGRFCSAHRIALIEDANAALGAGLDSAPIGTWGDFAVFSLYANRQVNGIEGALLVCRQAADAAAARRERRFGIDPRTFRDGRGEIDPASDVPAVGMSASLSHVHAALALFHLHSLDERLSRSRANAHALKEAFADLAVDGVAGARPAPWVMLMRCHERDGIMHGLKSHGIQCSTLHQANHVYSGFGANPRPLPGTDRFQREVIAVPCGWWIDEHDLQRIIATLGRLLPAGVTH